MKLKTLTLKLSLFRFFDEFILIYPAYTLLFRDSGLSTEQISYLLMIWASTGLILEIPTGVLADNFSRKHILIIGELFRLIGYGFWLVGDSFSYFAVGFIFWGIKGVLDSGTFESLIYDELKHLNSHQQYEKIYGRIKAFGFIGVTLALLFGGYVSQLSFDYALVASLISVFISTLIMFTLHPVSNSKTLPEVTLAKHLSSTLSQAVSPKILPILLTIGIALGVFGQLDEFYPLIFSELNFSLTTIGIATAFGTFLYTLGSNYSHLFFPNSRHIHTTLIFVFTLEMLSTLIFHSQVYIIFVAFSVTPLVAILETKLNTTLQHQTFSQHRATLISLSNLILEAFIIGFLSISGYVAQKTASTLILIPVVGVILIPSLLTSIGIGTKSNLKD